MSTKGKIPAIKVLTELGELRINLGELTKKQIKELRQGTGSEVEKILAAVKQSLSSSYSGKEKLSDADIIPVVLLCSIPIKSEE